MSRADIFWFFRAAIFAIFFSSCVMLSALFVRSYWWRDSFFASLPGVNLLEIESKRGNLLIGVRPVNRQWNLGWQQAAQLGGTSAFLCRKENYLCNVVLPWGPMVVIPYWYATLLAGTLAAACWVPWRYSLRTLLIAMVPVAVALELIRFTP